MNFRESPTNTLGKKFCVIFIFATRSRLTTPPTNSHMETVTLQELSVYFNGEMIEHIMIIMLSIKVCT